MAIYVYKNLIFSNYTRNLWCMKALNYGSYKAFHVYTVLFPQMLRTSFIFMEPFLGRNKNMEGESSAQNP